MKSPKVSILIPVFNRKSYISDCIQSALDQTISSIEIIIVDNASNDGTWEICQEYANRDQRIRIFRNDTNIGPVRNWKKCLDNATGKYGKILWSDDLMGPDFLKKTLPFLQNDLEVAFVITGIEIFNDNNVIVPYFYVNDQTGYYKTNEYIDDVLFYKLKKYPVSPGCALFRTKDLKENLILDISNKINSDFSIHGIGSDQLLFLLTAAKYPKFVFVKDKLAFFRLHKSCISKISGEDKLMLHYDLAKAYFVENFITATSSIKNFNTILWLDLLKYNGRKYGLYKISDFYMRNKEYSMNIFFIFKKIINILMMKCKIKH